MIGRHPALQVGSRIASTPSNSFSSRDSRTLFTHLPARIACNSFPVIAVRTLAKTTEGSLPLSAPFPTSIFTFPFSVSSLFSSACCLFVSLEKVNSHGINNLQPHSRKHPGVYYPYSLCANSVLPSGPLDKL